MRKILVAGILALVVIGCVLVAGCTNVSTTDGNEANAVSGMASDAALTYATTPKIYVTVNWYDGLLDDNASKTIQVDKGSKISIGDYYDADLYPGISIYYVVNGEETQTYLSSFIDLAACKNTTKPISISDGRRIKLGEKLVVNDTTNIYIK